MADFLRNRRLYQKRWEPSIRQLFVNNVAKRQQQICFFKFSVGDLTKILRKSCGSQISTAVSHISSVFSVKRDSHAQWP